MKKIALLPIAALLMLASCKDDDPAPRPAIPTDPVTTVESVADQVTLNVPEQSMEYELDGSLYRFKYANGQEITYTMANDATQGYVARVRKISGASEVVIPPVVKVIGAVSGNEIEYKVIALDLYQDGVAPGVKKLTLAKSVVAGIGESNALVEVTGAWFRSQLEMLPDLEEIELETGFPKFCSIQGALYSDDMKTLVAVPRARNGIFTIAEDTETVDERAFYYCNKLTAITFPAAVKEIKSGAVDFTEMLVLLNMQPDVAPKTAEDAFGLMARTSLLRIPAGSRTSYFPEKPDMEEPVMPGEPSLDASDEEWEAYDKALAEYEAEMKVYSAAMAVYNNPAGFRSFTNVEEVNFK